MENPKSGDPGTFFEKVLILGMRGVRSRDFVYRPGFVSNPVNRTLICGDFLFNPLFFLSLVDCGITWVLHVPRVLALNRNS